MTIAAFAERQQREQAGRAWLAWHTAALGRTKRFPPFAQFYQRRPRPLTPAEQRRCQDEHTALAAAYAAQRKDNDHE